MHMTTQKFIQFLKGNTNLMVDLSQKLLTEALWRRWVTEKPMDEYYTRMTEIENANMLGLVSENQPPSEIVFNPGYTQVFTPLILAGLLDVSDLMQEFGRTDLLGQRGKQLTLSHSQTLDYIFHAYLELGDVAQASIPPIGSGPLIRSIGSDGLTLFNSAHKYLSPAAGVSTYSNISASYAQPTESAINTFRTQIRRWPDNQGNPYDFEIQDVIVPPDLAMTAFKTRNSTYEPESANNALSIGPEFIKGQCYDSAKLASTIAWYITTDCDEMNKVMLFNRRMGRITMDKNPQTGHMATIISTIFSHGAGRLRFMKVT